MPRKPEYLRDASMIPGGQSILIPGLKNFSGLRWGGTTTNRGQRSISIRLTKEQADYFVAEGCNVNVRPPKEPGDQESYALKLIINFKPKGDPLEFLNPTIDVGTDTTPPKRFDEDMLDLLMAAETEAQLIFTIARSSSPRPRIRFSTGLQEKSFILAICSQASSCTRPTSISSVLTRSMLCTLPDR